jgi:hypothetical protein
MTSTLLCETFRAFKRECIAFLMIYAFPVRGRGIEWLSAIVEFCSVLKRVALYNRTEVDTAFFKIIITRKTS